MNTYEVTVEPNSASHVAFVSVTEAGVILPLHKVADGLVNPD